MRDAAAPPSAPADSDDAEVIRRVLSGETDRFAELVERYQTVLYRHAFALVMDPDVAADMVQDAFVRTYVRLRECREPARYRAWLTQTLRHRCLDYLKESARRNVRLDDAGPFPDPGARPQTGVERARVRNAIGAALRQLPVEQREAFILRHVEDLGYEAVAMHQNASVSAVKMRALRARQALADALRRLGVTGTAVLSSSDRS